MPLILFPILGLMIAGCKDKKKSGASPRAQDAGQAPQDRNEVADAPPDAYHPPEEKIPCNPRDFVPQCLRGSLIFCPDSGFITATPVSQIPSNAFCVEGLVRECFDFGWRVKAEEDIREKWKWEECGGEGEVPDAGPMGDAGELPADVSSPDVSDAAEGEDAAQEHDAVLRPDAGEGPLADATVAADANPPRHLVEREVCNPLQEVVFSRPNMGEGPGEWRTTVDLFTCEPVCEAPDGGFPVHQSALRDEATTARFRVDPLTTALYLSVSGDLSDARLWVRVDSLEPAFFMFPSICEDHEFVFEDLIHNRRSVTEDGIVDVTLTSSGFCNRFLDLLRRGDPDAPCEEPQIHADPEFCALFIPFRVQLTACHVVEEWVGE